MFNKKELILMRNILSQTIEDSSGKAFIKASTKLLNKINKLIGDK